MVKCVATGKWFCNSRHNTLPASCIVYHMVRSRNKAGLKSVFAHTEYDNMGDSGSDSTPVYVALRSYHVLLH